MKRGLKVSFGILLLLTRWLPSWAATLQNLPLGDRLNVGDTLLSASGHVELGIFAYPADGTNHYLCVRYAKPIEQAVVWIANRGIPLSRQAYLALSAPSGDLQLLDPNNNVAQVPWSSSTANGAVVRAELLDTGNLALMDNTGIVLWDRFKNSTVTDTLLPGQYLYKTGNRSLTSWVTRDDPALGNGTYTFGWGARGNVSILQLAWTSPKVFSVWRGGAYIPGQDEESPHLIPNVDYVYLDSILGNLYFPSTPADTVIISGGDSISPSILKRLTLDSDGGLRIYQWTIGVSKTWTPEANWVVTERGSQCYAIGTCGPFSLCSMRPFGSLDRANCTCPYGFHPISTTDPSQGCTPVVPLSGSDLCDAAKVNLTVLPGVDMPFGGGYKNLTGPDSANCAEECLKDCECAGAVYSKAEQYCWMKKMPLYNLGYPTERLHGKDRTAYVKVSLFQPPPAEGISPGSGQSWLKSWGIPVFATVGGFLFVLLGLCICVFRGRVGCVEGVRGCVRECIRGCERCSMGNGGVPYPPFGGDDVSVNPNPPRVSADR